MGATLDSIIAINISLANASVQQKGFGRGLILGSSNRFTGGDLFRIYTSLAGMIADSFLVTDPEYKAAKAYFGQEVSPPDVMIGYAPSDVAQVETLTPAAHDTTLYTVTINGIVSSFTSGSGATATQIVTGLAAAINAQSPALPVVTSGSSTLILTSANAGEGFTIAASVNIAISHTTPDTGVDTALTAIQAQGGKDWYGLVLTSRGQFDLQAAAAWIESQPYGYIFMACSQEADVLTNVTTDVLSVLAGKSYLRTAYLWSDDQADFPDAAWIGEEFPKQPGSSNYAWKDLIGITPTSNAVLTDSKIAILEGKFGNYYMKVGGANVTQKGWVVGNQWIDVIVGRDWIKYTMQAAIYALFIQNDKIGFDDAGIGLICGAIRGVLKQAAGFGIITPSFVLNVPLAASISSGQKATRILPAITWTAELVGAINGLTVNGTITA